MSSGEVTNGVPKSAYIRLTCVRSMGWPGAGKSNFMYLGETAKCVQLLSMLILFEKEVLRV